MAGLHCMGDIEFPRYVKKAFFCYSHSDCRLHTVTIVVSAYICRCNKVPMVVAFGKGDI